MLAKVSIIQFYFGQIPFLLYWVLSSDGLSMKVPVFVPGFAYAVFFMALIDQFGDLLPYQ